MKTMIAARDRATCSSGALYENPVQLYPGDAELSLVDRTCGYGKEWMDDSDAQHDPIRSMSVYTFEKKTGLILDVGEKITVDASKVA
jgi:hypothetical protein